MVDISGVRQRVLEHVYQSTFVSDAFALYLFSFAFLSKHVPQKTVFDSDWDLLVVLDACRVDALREVADEYEFIEDVQARWSVGSTSKEWYLNTFTESHADAIEGTAIVTANGWADTVIDDTPEFTRWTGTKNSRFHQSTALEPLVERPVVDAADFGEYVSVISTKEDHDFGAAPFAETVTGAAVEVGRTAEFDRMVVHYLQPHAPYLSNARERGSITETELRPLKTLQRGGDEDEIWELYLENLRYVLDNVADLLDNTDADDVVITADHGELFGEWGIYGHLGGIVHPALRRVPWVETSAEDHGRLETNVLDRLSDQSEEPIEDHLKDLGYL